MPKRRQSGKVEAKQRTVGETIKKFFSDKKIEYGDDGLLTDQSVTFLKSYFKAEDCVSEGRTRASHTSQHGGHMTNAQLIDKLILPDDNLATKYKNISTQFSSERQQWTAILDTLCEQDAKWINSHRDYTVRNGTQFNYTTKTEGVMSNPADEHIEPCAHTTGYTITNRLIYACDTGDYATVVTTRNSAIPIGFSIQTAYPGMSYDTADESDELQRRSATMDPEKRRSMMTLYSGDYTEDIRQTKRYATADSVMAKAAILMQGRSDAIFGERAVTADEIKQMNISLSGVKTSFRDNSEYVTFTKYNDDGSTYKMTVKENDVFMQKLDKDHQSIKFDTDGGYDVKSVGRSRKSLVYIQRTHPEMYRFALAAEECVQMAKEDLARERSQARSKIAEQSIDIAQDSPEKADIAI